MYEIQFLPVSRQDITEILLYISDRLNAPKAVQDLLDSFEHSFSILKQFPYSYKTFHPIKPLVDEYRMFMVKNYAVFYCIQEPLKIVEIRRIIYSGRDLENRV